MYLLQQQLIPSMIWISSEHTCFPVTCEELWPTRCGPSSIKKHASWLIIITTSVCFLVQLGQTSGKIWMLASFSFFSTSNPLWLQIQCAPSQSLIMSFFRTIAVLESVLLKDVKTSYIYLHFKISCGFHTVQSNKVQVFLQQPSVALFSAWSIVYALVIPFVAYGTMWCILCWQVSILNFYPCQSAAWGSECVCLANLD